jgi:hypothetical protein
MNGLRRTLAWAALVGLLMTVACLWLASRDHIAPMQSAEIPLMLVAFAAWWGALSVGTKVGKARQVDRIPGLSGLADLWFAARYAPVWVITVTVTSGILLVAFGHSGSVDGLPKTREEALIAGTAIAAFFVISLPVLFSRHPAASGKERPNKSLERTREG